VQGQSKVIFDEEEDACLKEVPELNDTLKTMFHMRARPLKVLGPRKVSQGPPKSSNRRIKFNMDHDD
jgi:hypothetical protein